jgi:hypothetical protein
MAFLTSVAFVAKSWFMIKNVVKSRLLRVLTFVANLKGGGSVRTRNGFKYSFQAYCVFLAFVLSWVSGFGGFFVPVVFSVLLVAFMSFLLAVYVLLESVAAFLYSRFLARYLGKLFIARKVADDVERGKEAKKKAKAV